MRGLIEGIAFRPATGAYYFGDVHLRCVWLRTPDGRVTRFSAPDDRLLGVFRVAVDEARGALWVSMGALEQMDGFAPKHKGAGGLAELDLATGAVRRVVMAPDDGAPHLLGDFVQLADGTILATDVATAITAVDVLTADPAMPDATLGTLVGGDLVFIGDGGWNRFEPGKVDASPRPVPVLKVPWAAPRR